MFYVQTICIVWYILKRGGRSQNLVWNIYFNNVDWHYNYHENDKFKMIIISLNYITNAERNIIRKDQISCYNKYTVNRCSGNNEITYFPTSTGTTNVNDNSQADQKYTWNGIRIVSYSLFKIIIYEATKIKKNLWFLHYECR
jgi:putative salt-induced outer membrane protein YdiY